MKVCALFASVSPRLEPMARGRERSTQLPLAFGRDAAIVLTVAAFRRAKGIPLRMRPLFISKVNTFVQVGLIIAILAHLAQVVTFTDQERQALVLLAAMTTIVSWIAYLIEGLRALRQRQPAA